MESEKLTREELWAKQQICSTDVDYEQWNKERERLKLLSHISNSCIFTVDVFKKRYDFASENFADTFGYSSDSINKIQDQGDMLEERIHPDDREQMIEKQIQHSKFIYSLPFENRNDYSTTFQYRMLNQNRKYINVISRQQVIKKDRNGKAWIIMGILDMAPDQTPSETIKCGVINLKTGEFFNPIALLQPELQLTKREIEILHLIRQGLLSKEIADRLHLSIYTVNNHRKNILQKLNAANAIEAINQAKQIGLLE